MWSILKIVAIRISITMTIITRRNGVRVNHPAIWYHGAAEDVEEGAVTTKAPIVTHRAQPIKGIVSFKCGDGINDTRNNVWKFGWTFKVAPFLSHRHKVLLIIRIVFLFIAESKKNFLSPLNTNEDSQTQLMLPSDQLSPQLQHEFPLPEKAPIPIPAPIEKRYTETEIQF